MKLNVIDLFCGCGGLTKGFVDAGLNVVAGIDIWNKAIESYKKNFNHLAICADLTKLSPELFQKEYNTEMKQIDIIVGGIPCQSFSIAGRRDKNDPRNSLFVEFVKYVNYFHPKAYMIENVIGILQKKTANGEKVIDIIMKNFEENYNSIICKLYASDFYVPQNRRRVIIIGIRKDLEIIPTEPVSKSKKIPVKKILLPREEINKKYFLSQRAIDGINRRKKEQKEAGKGFGAQFLNLDKPSYTISARYWKDGYDALVKYNDKEIRRLTITELKRIQTFPDEFIIEGQTKEIIMQIGNAVACKFAKYLGKHLIKILQQ